MTGRPKLARKSVDDAIPLKVDGLSTDVVICLLCGVHSASNTVTMAQHLERK